MTRRTYGQFCGLAHALDVVGERWTLLIVRELSSGPKRYSQLLEALSGIGTSLLAARVRQLEADDIIGRRLLLDQPSAAVAYELTDAGRELAQAVVPLALWGARHHMDDDDVDHEAYNAEWSLTFFTGSDLDDLPSELDAEFEFQIDESVARLRIRDGHTTVTPGAGEKPSDVTIRASAATIAAIAGSRVTLGDAVTRGHLHATGDQTAIATLLNIVERRLTR
ncbi:MULTISPECIES: helix-turn-helix domain-containing protein [unclassified Mycolicibacterium]|uniref:winged helix-turn-helix transcriptional regulator n=1 Tax=unclassified Mycolicibacterium TaxID=2636767 RepID=UPI001F4C1EF6|nr:helix-turn-helix domain-containing protein [Mycolicibacterium sp. YH-1]UNB53210.1 helix-turn-helix transcriptional regulator [Mycolicibacterium sp. YH-1]